MARLCFVIGGFLALSSAAPVKAQVDWLNDPQLNLRQAVPPGAFDEAKARRALQRGADINFRYSDFGGQTVLMMAIQFGSPAEAVRLLLDKGADPNVADAKGRSAAHYATASGVDPTVTAMVLGAAQQGGGAKQVGAAPRQGVDANRMLQEAMAGYFINEAQARQALTAGADVNQRIPAADNATLLIDKVRQGADVSVIRWLLRNGADPNLKDARGRTAASYASPLSSPDVAALLGAGRPQAARPPAAPPAAQASAADRAAPIRPGVYECYGQSAMIDLQTFGILDGSRYMSSMGRQGRYSYDPRTGVLLLDPGPSPARFRRISERTFRAIHPDGSFTAFVCPLNTAKNPRRPPW